MNIRRSLGNSSRLNLFAAATNRSGKAAMAASLSLIFSIKSCTGTRMNASLVLKRLISCSERPSELPSSDLRGNKLSAAKNLTCCQSLSLCKHLLEYSFARLSASTKSSAVRCGSMIGAGSKTCGNDPDFFRPCSYAVAFLRHTKGLPASIDEQCLLSLISSPLKKSHYSLPDLASASKAAVGQVLSTGAVEPGRLRAFIL